MHELYGADLIQKMKVVISRSSTKKSSSEFKGSGEYLDADDLAVKYASKPDVCSCLIKTAMF